MLLPSAKLLNNKEIHMKKTTALAAIIAALSAFSAGAQVQTLVTGTNVLDTNSAVVTVPSDSYVQMLCGFTDTDYNVAVTMQGVSFDFDPGESLINGYTFTGPATIQVQGNTFTPTFATFNVVPLRKAVGTNIQTLAVSPTNPISGTINVSSNSIAVIESAITQSGANLIVTMQSVSNSYAVQNIPVSLSGFTFTGPATIQLQGDSFGSSFATVAVMPMRKSSKTQVETLVVSPANTNSATINIATNSYAAITSTDPNFNGTVSVTLQGEPFAFQVEMVNLRGATYAGPATIQLQGDSFNPSSLTVTTTRK